MDEESQVRGCYIITFICTPTRKQCRLSPEMKTWTPATTANNLPLQGHWRKRDTASPVRRDTGVKGTLLAQRSSFNTLDNWGHKTPTLSKRKSTGKKRLKGHGLEHVYNTLGYIYIYQYLTLVLWQCVLQGNISSVPFLKTSCHFCVCIKHTRFYFAILLKKIKNKKMI